MVEVNKIINGDCIEEMKKLPDNSVDAIITDPPYDLTSITKPRIDQTDEGSYGKQVPFIRVQSRGGFMGKTWDGTGIAFKPEVWIECLRVLKPGGYLLSFGGTRTYHRMTCAIEDAGFEIRDCIMWIYGSGFPKSLNIGKQIDKMAEENIEVIKAKQELGKWLKEKRGDKPMIEISKYFLSKTGGLTGCVSNWELGKNLPTWDIWIKLKEVLELDERFDYLIEGRPKNYISAEREITGKDGRGELKGDMFFSQDTKRAFEVGKSIGYGKWDLKDKPATDLAKQWEGWGTALKPAVEPIVVARKPLSEKNVALNVLKWGTGGINIDECRIETKEEIGRNNINIKNSPLAPKDGWNENSMKGLDTRGLVNGRFPANILFDEEAGKMLDEQSGIKKGNGHWSKTKTTGFGEFGNGKSEYFGVGEKDTLVGGASRFFYCAKASKSERNFGCEELEESNVDYGERMGQNNSPIRPDGTERKPNTQRNNHPTVKPIKLIEYLIKLVSKEGTIILDPFLGSGTTAVACVKLNRNFIGIEKEPEYVKIAEARIKPFLEQEMFE